jgi:hypothetical protein
MKIDKGDESEKDPKQIMMIGVREVVVGEVDHGTTITTMAGVLPVQNLLVVEGTQRTILTMTGELPCQIEKPLLVGGTTIGRTTMTVAGTRITLQGQELRGKEEEDRHREEDRGDKRTTEVAEVVRQISLHAAAVVAGKMMVPSSKSRKSQEFVPSI